MTAKERHAKFRKTAKHRAYQKWYQAAYKSSAHGQAVRKAYWQRYQADSKNREMIKRKRDKYRQSERYRAVYFGQFLRQKYDLTVGQYDVMCSSQNGVCAICRGSNLRGKRLWVDHDHITGKVRGLLCDSCNKALGHMRDNSTTLRRAADYLDLHSLLNGSLT